MWSLEGCRFICLNGRNKSNTDGYCTHIESTDTNLIDLQNVDDYLSGSNEYRHIGSTVHKYKGNDNR